MSKYDIENKNWEYIIAGCLICFVLGIIMGLFWGYNQLNPVIEQQKETISQLEKTQCPLP